MNPASTLDDLLLAICSRCYTFRMNVTFTFVASLLVFTLVNAAIFAVLSIRIEKETKSRSAFPNEILPRLSAVEAAVPIIRAAHVDLVRQIGIVNADMIRNLGKAITDADERMAGRFTEVRDRITAIEAKSQPKKTTPTPGSGTGSWADVKRAAELGEQRLKREEDNTKNLTGTPA